VRERVLQRAAIRCSVLQSTAVCCSVLQWCWWYAKSVVIRVQPKGLPISFVANKQLDVIRLESRHLKCRDMCDGYIVYIRYIHLSIVI